MEFPLLEAKKQNKFFFNFLEGKSHFIIIFIIFIIHLVFMVYQKEFLSEKILLGGGIKFSI